MENSYKKFNNDADLLASSSLVDDDYLSNSVDGRKLSDATKEEGKETNRNLDPLGEPYQNVGQQSHSPRRVRLRAVETEVEFFLRLLNVTLIKRFCWVQVTASLTILVCQILLYSAVTQRYYKPVDITGIGIWAPLFFFFIAAGLTILATSSPTGCLLGTAMGFQITSSFFGCLLALLSCLSLTMHGHWGPSDNCEDEYIYKAEITGRVLCSFMVFSAVIVVVTCIFISVQLCRATCCGRHRATEALLFDTDIEKIEIK